ncbi:ABC transporter substrate-binding protein [Buchananella hordeovulneris]|uniref:ABC transporter substrate-binding protein n=1 Tax=Buchananella hordeovulneris TaxID=52770 RepID=UPI000B06AF45|nr:ABC transporter substrate-binding protein [Buchananella hordeovulneris]MDO5081451.1 ABC transporter substrate-binding protein [Buchananella hordeovulneris]RRD43413.1 ABC transporter substrate-binding protein [Buchananella hordeovulneris]RRD51030.1 ABC transporter substrate-binding protein [Buchananella hordeovulneris]
MTQLPVRRFIAATAVALVALAGCSSDTTSSDSNSTAPGDGKQSTAADAGGEELLRVGFSQLGAESGWRTANTESIKATFTEANGYELTFVDAQQKQENQIKALRDFIDQDVDVIAFSPVVETGWDEVLQEIKDAGIPVVLSDRTIETSVPDAYVTFIGSDFVAEGRTAGEWVKANVPEPKIFELQGTLGSGPQLDREAGFGAVMSDKIIGKASGNFTRAEGKIAVEAALQAYPEMNVIFAHNDDMGLGAIEAVEAAGKKPGVDIKIVTIDGVRDGLQALVDGKFNFVVECNPMFGEQLGQVLRDAKAGKDLPDKVIVKDQTFDQTITQEVVDQRPY